MYRRSFLAAAAGGLTRCAFGFTGPRPAVTSDIGPLRRVLVHTPGPEARQRPRDEPDRPWGLAAGPMPPEASSQHQALVARLRAGGAEVLPFRELLDEALHEAAHAGALHFWVAHAAPGWSGVEEELTASTLVEGLAGPREEGAPANPVGCLLFTRDLAVMTPRGLVLGSFLNRDRRSETELLRFALHWSPRLREVALAFDAGAEGLYLQGGDLTVLDERTLLLGVGNLTEPAAARRLARRLDMDVVSVQLPGDGRFGDDVDLAGWNRLRTVLLHLDSACTLVDRRAAILAPYLLEVSYADRGPSRRLAGALEEILGERAGGERTIREIGRVRVFRAGSGEAARGTGMKLGDYLRSRGYRLHYAGGPPPERIEADHLADRVIPELERQGANVVALGPGQVVAYAENEHSLRGLTDAEVAVEAFSGSHLARWHGGPHCLTLPLEREPLDEVTR
jgi:arginine deiminase